MTLAIPSTSKRAQAANPPPEPETEPIDHQLVALSKQVIAYARAAKIQYFRYCQRPSSPHSRYSDLAAAVHALIHDLDQAKRQPLCQTLAVELLRDLAALAQKPPCQNEEQRVAAAKVIDNAILELR